MDMLHEEVKLGDMIWADKLGKSNTTTREWLRKARRAAANPDMQEGSMDDFMNKLGIICDPDPSNYKTCLMVQMKCTSPSNKVNLVMVS